MRTSEGPMSEALQKSSRKLPETAKSTPAGVLSDADFAAFQKRQQAEIEAHFGPAPKKDPRIEEAKIRAKENFDIQKSLDAAEAERKRLAELAKKQEREEMILAEQIATERRIAEVNKQIDADAAKIEIESDAKKYNTIMDEANTKEWQTALMESEQKEGERRIAEVNRQIDAVTASEIKQAEKQKLQAEVRASNQPAIDQAKSNPDKLSKKSQEIAEQNQALLKGTVADLIHFAKENYGISLNRNGEPSTFSKFKGLFGKNKGAEDPRFLSIQAELKRRTNSITSASIK